MRTLRAWQPSLRERLGKNALGGERFSRKRASVRLARPAIPAWSQSASPHQPYFDATNRAIGIAAKLRGLRKISPKIWLWLDLREGTLSLPSGADCVPKLDRKSLFALP